LEKNRAKMEEKVAQKNEVLSELMEEHVKLRKALGRSESHLGSSRYKGCDRGLHRVLVEAKGVDISRFLIWIGIVSGKFYDWKGRYGNP
jgi:hypothetical protein